MKRVTPLMAEKAALFAVADMGGRLLVSEAFAKSMAGYTLKVWNAMITDHAKACRIGAYCIERPFYGDGRHGWRLNKLLDRGGQADVGPFFKTASEFEAAMRMVSAMAGMRS